jgi:hypothetical protein
MKRDIPFVGKVEIGKTYLDTWGRRHSIEGYVVLRRGWGSESDTFSKDQVWSTGGWHFDINTGTSVHAGKQLVQLPPKDELAFWTAQIKQIKSVNSADKLELIETELATMAARIQELSK